MFFIFLNERKNDTSEEAYSCYNNESYNVISTCGMPAVDVISNIKYVC